MFLFFLFLFCIINALKVILGQADVKVLCPGQAVQIKSVIQPLGGGSFHLITSVLIFKTKLK